MKTVSLKKGLVFGIIFLFVCINFTTISGKQIFEKNNTNFKLKKFNFESKLFDLKINLLMKLAHMKSISACVIKNNTMVWSNGYGFSNRALLQSPTINTNYMIGSISKVITATAILQLYENESYDFELDDNVNKYLPFDLKNPNFNDINITFRMLLAHQSSLHDHDSAGATNFLFTNKPFSFIQEILLPEGDNYLEDCWAVYQPGSEANYSNLAFTLLGYLIERITNQTYEEYCQEHIFKPLKMKNTSFIMNNIEKSDLAVPYFYLPGIYIRVAKTDFNFYDPCGGLYTTVEDLSHLFIAHLNGGIYEDVRILEESTIDMMHTVQYPESSPYFGNARFGLGWMIIVDENDEAYWMGHAGDLICYHARMFVDINDNTSIIYFYNSGGYPLFINLMYRAQNKITNLLFEKAKEF
jgi:CubicO group peptidase (beta-lactamase class C family)